MADNVFDFSPGAQVPLTGSAGRTVATHALASAAYRDSPVEEILKADNEWHKSGVSKGKFSLFEPNLGEAFSRAVQVRMLGGGRGALIQSFGMEPQTVVEHALAATHIRKERDKKLTAVTVLFGRALPARAAGLAGRVPAAPHPGGIEGQAGGLLGGVLLTAVAVPAGLFLLKLPFTGVLGWYLRGMIVAPVIGWVLAKRICEATAKDLRLRWDDLLSGGGLGAEDPRRRSGQPGRLGPEALRQGLHQLTAEQHSNVVFYAGPQGDTRHGHPLGQLAARGGAGLQGAGQGHPPVPQL